MQISRVCRGGLVPLAFVVVALAGAGRCAFAQQQRGLPATRFGSADLKKLQWLEGRWHGTATGQQPYYEAYHFVNDSTLEVTYYADSAFSRTSGGARVYVSVGRIYHRSGPATWGASHVDEHGAYFVPEGNASGSLSWAFQSPDSWTETVRTSATGQEKVTVYQMQRVK